MYNSPYDHEHELYSYATTPCKPECKMDPTSLQYHLCCNKGKKAAPSTAVRETKSILGKICTDKAGNMVPCGPDKPAAKGAPVKKGTPVKGMEPIGGVRNEVPAAGTDKPLAPAAPGDTKFNFKEYLCPDPVNVFKKAIEGGNADEAAMKCMMGWGGLALVGILVLQKLKL
jgi:hypothetical protein